MVIEIPGCKFRISGESCDWQVQYPGKSKGEGVWRGVYFYPTLEGAVSKAYELALRDSEAKVDLKAALAECRRVKTSLEKAVKAAVACR